MTQPLRTDWTNYVDEVDADAMNAIGQAVNELAVTRRSLHHIDAYGGDPTGVNDSNQALIDAYNALGDGPGAIVFGAGTYKLYAGLNDDVGRELAPRQAVVGQGAGLTTIDWRGPGAFVEMRNRDFDATSSAAAGGVHGMRISGWNSGEDNSYGLRYGDIWRMRTTDLEIVGFTRAGCIGLWGDNQSRWSERARIECMVDQCTECYVFESNTGESWSGSFDYSDYDLSFIAQPDQHAFVLRSGVAGSAVSMNGVDLRLTGNCQRGTTNTGELFRVGKDNDDQAGFSGTLNIGVETSGSSGETHFDFMMGDGPSWEVQSRVSATGAINLIPFSGADFQQGNATPQTFAFAGLLKNSPALGSTGTVQAFQPLQLLSQARGNWYLDDTDCVQTVYITKSTGGTFTLSYGGYTTSALAHNATAAQVETALRALTSVGGANVWVYDGQARYVNGVAQDEHAYILWFGGALGSTDLALVTVNGASLTGTGHAADVVMKAPGSPNGTFVVPLEQGNICKIDPAPGTYRLRSAVGGLTKMAAFGDSPFGVTCVDIWIKQPDTGGPAVFEGPWFVPEALSGSSYHFEWMDGQTPTLSTTPGAFDIIRLTSYNFSTWIGQHITVQPGAAIHAASDKATPVNADEIALADSEDSWKRKRLSFSNLKAAILSYIAGAAAVFSNKDLTGAGNTFPTLNQNTAGTAAGITGKTTPTGALVGTTDAQTLTDKTIIQRTNVTPVSGSTLTITTADAPVQIFTGTGTHTLKLPTTGVTAGRQWYVINTASSGVPVQASNGSTIVTMGNTAAYAVFTALVDTPTNPGHWHVFSPWVWVNGNTVAQRDGNGWIFSSGFTPYRGQITSAAGTTTLTAASPQVQQVTGTTTQTVKLPTTSVYAGMSWIVVNNSTGAVTVQSSGANSITNGTVAAGAVVEFFALQDTPTAGTHWYAK